MAQTGFTPTKLYRSATAGTQPLPANLVDGELAINTADGKLFYKNSSGTVSTIISGSDMGKVPTSSTSFALGTGSLNANTTGIDNTGIGYFALQSNTTGSANTAIGSYALSNSTVGAQNTAIGTNSLRQNTTGNFNTAIGANSLRFNTTGFNNTAIGDSALQNNTTGNENAAIGKDALSANTTGIQNTAIGTNALQTTTTGSNNTGVGSGATSSTPTVSNEITLGNSSITSLRCQVTSITSLSDERDKTDWDYNIAGLKFINDLKPAYFTWNTRDKAKVGLKAAGFSAQHLLSTQEKHNAENLDLVSTLNPEKLEARYSNLLPSLVKSIQELSEKVDRLNTENETLKQDIINLRNSK